MKEIGSKIRILRYKKGWSQENLAQKIGVSIFILSQIESGEIDIQYSLLRRIATVFEVPLFVLFASEEQVDAKKVDLSQLNEKIKQYDLYIQDLQSHYERVKEGSYK